MRALPLPIVKLKRLLPLRGFCPSGNCTGKSRAEVSLERAHEDRGVVGAAEADPNVAVVRAELVDAAVANGAVERHLAIDREHFEVRRGCVVDEDVAVGGLRADLARSSW